MRRFCLSSFSFTFYLLSFILFLSCAQPTDSTDEGTVEREQVEVSGSIVEDAVWECKKEYVVTGDVTVKQGATLTIQPDVVVKFTHEHADEYVGITVEGTLIADEEDVSTGICWGCPRFLLCDLDHILSSLL